MPTFTVKDDLKITTVRRLYVIALFLLFHRRTTNQMGWYYVGAIWGLKII